MEQNLQLKQEVAVLRNETVMKDSLVQLPTLDEMANIALQEGKRP